MTTNEAAELFRQMAERLELNPDATFGGAFLIVPPGDEPNVIDGLTITTNPNVAVFWSYVNGQVDLAVSMLKAGQQQGRGYR